MSDERFVTGGILERGDRPTARRRIPAVGLRGMPALVWGIAFAIAGAFLLVFVARLAHNIAVVNWNSDYASEFLVPETLVRTGTGGHTVLSTSGQYVSLWFGLLTARLPLHRQLWELSPTLLFIATVLVIGWSVAQVAARRAALLAMALAFVVSPWAWFVFIAPGAHNTVYLWTALLGAYLIWLTRGEGRRRALVIGVPLLAGVLLGVCLASDALNIASGLVPLAVTAVLVGVRRSRRSRIVALSALVTVAVSVLTAEVTTSVMHSLGFLTIPPTPEAASLAAVPQHAELLYEGLTLLFNGYLGHHTVETAETTGTLHALLGTVCVVVMAVALLTLLVMGAVAGARLLWSGRRPVVVEAPGQLARRLHVIYWLGAGAAPCVVFALGNRVEYVHVSYYASILFAVAAVIPLLLRAGSPARWLVPAGASILFLASFVGLTSNYVDTTKLPSAAYGSRVVALARANHVIAGYAGYRDAASLTWSSREQVLVRPVSVCPNPGGVELCPFFLERVPSWYVPQKRRSFLLANTGEPYLPGLPPGLGQPLATYELGPMRMYVYSYDIASRFGPPPN
jgi:hypothetical protein